MKRFLNPLSHLGNVWQLVRWSFLVVPVAVMAGSASALFLWSLDRVTQTRWTHPWLLFGLPIGGVAVGFLYHWFGRNAEKGNNLILEEIHEPGGGVPTRMAPLVLIGTLITHLFGGSAGREGTAVQMGGSLADGFGRWFRIKPENRRVLLLAGVAAGFGSVFGTPLTGAIFALEVVVVGRVQYDALIPVLVASVVGDFTCGAWGIHHTEYHIAFADSTARFAALTPQLLGATVVGGILFGLAGKLFAELTHALQHLFKKLVPYAPLRPALGAVLVIGLTFALGTRDFLGIGVASPDPHGVSILSAFTPGGAAPFSWWWKLLFTAVTLAAGFKGGEVTPLFFIGAALGHVLGVWFGLPVDLFAGLGFIAVFAGAANTPLACTVMGVELFGSPYLVYYAVACFIAYYFSGHSSIYLAQRVGVPKNRNVDLPADVPLREAREVDATYSELTFARLADRLARFEPKPISSQMNKQHRIVSRELGKIRIYLTPRERVAATGLWDRLNPRPVYREIINAAKKEGLQSAVAFMTHYGYSNGDKVRGHEMESANNRLTLCVEIIDQKTRLEAFCRHHGALFKDRTIVYKHVEHWAVHEEGLIEEDGSPDEVVDGDETPLEATA
ncbi:MAG TPA: DUF190 domain-containing protein [Opitutaceae bacterium]|nr:DUF190 domain-containing protein [Opitutaceae bacterium]